MATCNEALYEFTNDCTPMGKRLVSFLLDDTNKSMVIDGIQYKFDSIDERAGTVTLINDNCQFLHMQLDLFGRLHAMALSGIHEFNVLI